MISIVIAALLVSFILVGLCKRASTKSQLQGNLNTVVLEVGDKISHPKYGKGVVEKVIKDGEKALYSIIFKNGRRLLDPTVSEIQKL